MMKITVITLFPQMFEPILNTSILKRAQNKGLVEYHLLDLRQFGEGKHQIVDDRPYGGGPGMVLKADILAKAWQSAAQPSAKKSKPYTLLMSASGTPFKHSTAEKLSSLDQLIVVCGHYEGVDQRFIDQYVDEEVSIGDYVLTGGELPAMVLIDATVRLIPQVLNKEEAALEESFAKQNGGLLEYPQYTRPETFGNLKVPEILLSGNHQQIADWRKLQSLEKTKKIRPDLLKD